MNYALSKHRRCCYKRSNYKRKTPNETTKNMSDVAECRYIRSGMHGRDRKSAGTNKNMPDVTKCGNIRSGMHGRDRKSAGTNKNM